MIHIWKSTIWIWETKINLYLFLLYHQALCAETEINDAKGRLITSLITVEQQWVNILQTTDLISPCVSCLSLSPFVPPPPPLSLLLVPLPTLSLIVFLPYISLLFIRPSLSLSLSPSLPTLFLLVFLPSPLYLSPYRPPPPSLPLVLPPHSLSLSSFLPLSISLLVFRPLSLSPSRPPSPLHLLVFLLSPLSLSFLSFPPPLSPPLCKISNLSKVNHMVRQ